MYHSHSASLMVIVSVFLLFQFGCSCDGQTEDDGSDDSVSDDDVDTDDSVIDDTSAADDVVDDETDDSGDDVEDDSADDSDDSDDDTDDDPDDDSTDDSDDDLTDDDFLDDDTLAPPPSDEVGVFVATTGNDSNPGTMTEPVRTINVGIDLAEPSEKSVFVAEGEYQEDVETHVSLFGGYEAFGWTRDISNHVTTITAFGMTALVVSGDDPITVQGFKIIGGSEEDFTFGVINMGTAATLANCVVFGGSGSNESDAMRNHSGSMTLIKNSLHGGSGGSYSFGVKNRIGSVRLVDNIIEGGSSGGGSTGFCNDGGVSPTAILINNIIKGGSGSVASYGVVNDHGTATLANNYIEGGAGSFLNEGIHNRYGTITLVNNIINGGFAGTTYGVGNYHSTSLMTLVNNDIWGDDQDCLLYDGTTCVSQPDAINACGWEGCVSASANISADPLMIDPAGGDFHLQYESPCRDAGIDPVPDFIDWSVADYDFEGDPRPDGSDWDIGVDEWTSVF